MSSLIFCFFEKSFSAPPAVSNRDREAGEQDHCAEREHRPGRTVELAQRAAVAQGDRLFLGVLRRRGCAGLPVHSAPAFAHPAAAKALLTEAGIPNVDVVKSDTSHSSHYWLLVDVGSGWYHFDPTPRDGEGDYFFLVTDEQLDTYSAAHEDSHVFDHNAYPAKATEIITDLNAQPSHDEVYP